MHTQFTLCVATLPSKRRHELGISAANFLGNPLGGIPATSTNSSLQYENLLPSKRRAPRPSVRGMAAHLRLPLIGEGGREGTAGLVSVHVGVHVEHRAVQEVPDVRRLRIQDLPRRMKAAWRGA